MIYNRVVYAAAYGPEILEYYLQIFIDSLNVFEVKKLFFWKNMKAFRIMNFLDR